MEGENAVYCKNVGSCPQNVAVIRYAKVDRVSSFSHLNFVMWWIDWVREFASSIKNEFLMVNY